MQEQIAKSKVELDQATSDYQKAFSQAHEIEEQVRTNESELMQAQYKLDSLKNAFGRRLVHYYKTGPTNYLSVLAFSRTYGDLVHRLIVISHVMERDIMMTTEFRDAIDRLEERKVLFAQSKDVHAIQLKATQEKKLAIEHNLRLQQTILDNLNKRILAAHARPGVKIAMATPSPLGRSYVSRGAPRGSIVFPVAGPHSYIDSWGFSRSGGRRHKGCDIMAATGTPLVACMTGVITKTSPRDHGLGGISLYLRGDDGTTYYYAHLSRIAANISPGTRVLGGQVIGFVGYTGNADLSSPHLHFEIHPGGGAPINPYPALRASQR